MAVLVIYTYVAAGILFLLLLQRYVVHVFKLASCFKNPSDLDPDCIQCCWWSMSWRGSRSTARSPVKTASRSLRHSVHKH